MKPMRPLTVLAFVFLLAACDKGSEPPAETVAASRATASVWVPGWKQGTSMATARSGSAVVKTKDVIHIIGGVDGKNFLASSEYARILPDGSLSAWKAGSTLNVERGFTSAVRYKNHVYIAGGGRGDHGQDLLNSVERAEILPDGTLGEWVQEKYPMNIKRRCSKLAIVGNYLYAFGGFGGILLDTVERAEILPDGSLDEWLMLSDRMTVPRYIADVQSQGDIVYMVGGHDKVKGVGIPNVEWSESDKEEEGFLKPWKTTSPLLTGRYGLSVANHGGNLYAMGGLDGARYLDNVEKARMKPEGGLMPWEETTPLPSSREGFMVVTDKDTIYIIGGGNLHGYWRSVEYAHFNDSGDIGFWATPEEAAAHEAALAAKQEQQRSLPNEAVIVENIKASAYSYLHVRRADGLSAWLAAPLNDLPVGTKIGFPNGVFMSNFYSKELKRNFPAIMFVGEVRADR